MKQINEVTEQTCSRTIELQTRIEKIQLLARVAVKLLREIDKLDKSVYVWTYEQDMSINFIGTNYKLAHYLAKLLGVTFIKELKTKTGKMCYTAKYGEVNICIDVSSVPRCQIIPEIRTVEQTVYRVECK